MEEMHSRYAANGISSIPHSYISRAIYWSENGPIVGEKCEANDRTAQRPSRNAISTGIAKKPDKNFERVGFVDMRRHSSTNSLWSRRMGGGTPNKVPRLGRATDVTQWIKRRAAERKREVEEDDTLEQEASPFLADELHSATRYQQLISETYDSENDADKFPVEKLSAGVLSSDRLNSIYEYLGMKTQQEACQALHEERPQPQEQQTFRTDAIERANNTSRSTIVLETDDDSTSADMDDGGDAIPMESTRNGKEKGPFTWKGEKENTTKTSDVITARSIFGV